MKRTIVESANNTQIPQKRCKFTGTLFIQDEILLNIKENPPKKKRNLSAKALPCTPRLPDVLVIHLKRFRYTTYRRDKITTCISIPESALDVSPYMSSHRG